MHAISQICKEAKEIYDNVSKVQTHPFLVTARIHPHTFTILKDQSDPDKYVTYYSGLSVKDLRDKYKINTIYYAFDVNHSFGTTPIILDGSISFGKSRLEVVNRNP